jgi:hypothetical protein
MTDDPAASLAQLRLPHRLPGFTGERHRIGP